MIKIKRALISVWDKTNLKEFAKFLIDNYIEIISTGGTMTFLKNNGFDVTPVSKITNCKYIMDGRVKTLHPKIFGGILADRDNPSHLEDLVDIEAGIIDLVVVNLYPFKEEVVEKNLDLKKAIEFIDIGGPSMLRAAAKNYQHVIPISQVSEYERFMNLFISNKGLFPLKERKEFALRVFKTTYSYDLMISNYLDDSNKQNNKNINFKLVQAEELRYGENPHQRSSFYLPEKEERKWKQLNGKKLSYNNYFDIETAISIVYEFDEIACSIIKHANPCGFSIGTKLKDVYLNAVKTDPVSYFGGIVGFNYEVNEDVANELIKSFLECIVAPSFSKTALKILRNKKNLRVISISKEDLVSGSRLSIKSSFNGFLIQDKDSVNNNNLTFKVVSNKKPNKLQLKALHLSWKLVKYVKSNAIVFSNHKYLLGVGAGQMSRIDSVKLAIRKSKENNLDLEGSIMSSDAFFPFPDSIKLAKKVGAVGVIQPGGSINDLKIIDEINKHDMFMIFTNIRHFNH